jgi:hypothetical protein
MAHERRWPSQFLMPAIAKIDYYVAGVHGKVSGFQV